MTARSIDRSPVLLFDGSYYGTLAAARCLGRAGIALTIAEPKLLAPARWSRYVRRRVHCPDPADADQFIAWLLAWGKQQPGYMLYPTSDDLAWLFARHRDQLMPYFKLFQPDVDAIYTLLNKRRLHDACAAVGLDTPHTLFPDSNDALDRLADQIAYPVLIKPQTQIMFASHIKGAQVHSAAELRQRYRQFVAANGFGSTLRAFDPGVEQPMVQTYHREASEHIYSLSGFVDQTGTIRSVRAARKVLQRPRKLGIGLCFEEAEVDAALCDRLAALCRHIGYYGVFEVEFIRVGDQYLLIDFNPRFYSQMAFEIARQLPLPLIAYYAAITDQIALDAALDQARSWRSGERHIYCHRFVLEVLLRAQHASGRLSPREARHWRRWHRTHRAIDAVADRRDPLPGMIDVALYLSWYARHPRAFVRQMVLDQ